MLNARFAIAALFAAWLLDMDSRWCGPCLPHPFSVCPVPAQPSTSNLHLHLSALLLLLYLTCLPILPLAFAYLTLSSTGPEDSRPGHFQDQLHGPSYHCRLVQAQRGEEQDNPVESAQSAQTAHLQCMLSYDAEQ
jgi:hypothetical protein